MTIKTNNPQLVTYVTIYDAATESPKSSSPTLSQTPSPSTISQTPSPSTSSQTPSPSTSSQTPSPSTISTKRYELPPLRERTGSTSQVIAGTCLQGFNKACGRTLTPLVIGAVGLAGGALVGAAARASATIQKIGHEAHGLNRKGMPDAAAMSAASALLRVPFSMVVGLFIGTDLYKGVQPGWGGMAVGLCEGVEAAEMLRGEIKATANDLKKGYL